MFALAVGNFSIVSQTFVRQHAERIAPGNSVFVSHQSYDNPPLPGAHLFALKKKPQVTRSDFRLSPLAPLTPRNWIIADFLRFYGVTTMLTEFGTYGAKILPSALAAGCRYYVHFHGWDASSVLRDPAFVRKYQKMFVQADGFFAPSQFIANNLIEIGCPREKIWITPCGVDVDDFPKSIRIPQRCLAIGRFVQKKSPQSTVQAFAKAVRGHPNAHLDFVGDGPLFAETKALAEALGIKNQVTFHGSKPHHEVREMLCRSSIFLQHSVMADDGNVEGLPVAILEGMCAGLAAVSTYHSGIPEAVIDGETGFLVHEHDVEAMSDKISTLFDHPDLVEKMGKAGRVQAMDNFNIDRSVAILREKMGL